MSRGNRFAFTLVELLVVIVIIGMLAALLLRAVSGAREAARRTQCVNYQEEIGKAVAGYEQAKQQLPGDCNANLAPTIAPTADGRGGVTSADLDSDWATRPQNANRNRPGLSWAIMLLPYIGRDDLFTAWRTCQLGGLPAAPGLAQFVCPSDSEKQARLQQGALSYVVNSGLPDCSEGGCPGGAPQMLSQLYTGTYNPRDYGLFLDPYCHRQVTVTTSNIPDGASNTLMLSENLQATCVVPSQTHTEQTDVAMVWWPSQALGASVPAYVKINSHPDPLHLEPLWYARPSSNHPGGVVVTYADGRVTFLNQDIHYGPPATPDDLSVYQQLMCPNDAAANAAGLFGPPET